jgi:GTP cyclohydrolase II
LYKRQVKAFLPTKWGTFSIYAYAANSSDAQPHLTLVHELTNLQDTVPVRIHSECITGDLFGSRRCDCGQQFDQSMHIISERGGIMIYLRQEGRGIGLISKLEAYNLQDQGMDTIQANVHLGFEPDERDFSIATFILTDLGVTAVDLITNNPDKMATIGNSAIQLRKRIPLIIPSGSENEHYLRVKQEVLGHLL